MKSLFIMTLVLAITSLGFNIILYFNLRQLKCDSVKGVFAERNYVYPILRDLGYEPGDYGKDTLNPLTTSGKYAFHCD